MKGTLNSVTAIVPAAGRPTNKIIFNNNLPDTMLPINGKPVIGYIIEDLLDRGIKNIIVVLNATDQHTEKYIVKKYGDKSDLKIVYDRSTGRGLGYSIFLGSEHVSTNHVLVYLGDTIYKGPLSFEKSFLVTTDKYDDCNKWCFVEKKNKKMTFINKPQTYNGLGQVTCGLYYFHQAGDLKKILVNEEKSKERLEIYHLLAPYSEIDRFVFVPAERWYDCGNIENYYQAKIDFLGTRAFNSIKYNDLYGIINKSGFRAEKIRNEISWYRQLPAELKIFAPRLIDFKLKTKYPSYSLEFYGYQSLDEIFIFGYLDEKIWRIILERLLDIVLIFRKYKKDVPLSDYQMMYEVKINERLKELKSDPWWDDLLSFPEVVINGQVFKNVSYFLPKIKNIARKLYVKKDVGLIHGDLSFNNILFDPGNRIFKFIDPRGSFGRETLYGDIKYDLAKLRFSLSGQYDFIVADLFKVENGGKLNEWSYVSYGEDYHCSISQYFDKLLIKRGFDLKRIRVIEALLFLSVIPHHYDFPERQKAMFITAIKLLNEVF